MRSGFSIVVVWGLLLAGSGCATTSDPASGHTVVVSVLPQAYAVERIAGELARVEVMIPPGASPATYEPTVYQMRAISRADVYVKVGHRNFPFERAWLDRLIAERRDLVVVNASEGLSCNAEDPHFWVSPGGMRTMARNVERALTELLPEHRDRLRQNLAGFLDEIDELDEEIGSMLKDYAGRRFLVFHPAWGCFADAYGLQQVSIENGAKEPGPHELARLIDAARAESTRVIFVQPQSSNRSADELAGEIGAEVVSIDPLKREWPSMLRSMSTALLRSYAAVAESDRERR